MQQEHGNRGTERLLRRQQVTDFTLPTIQRNVRPGEALPTLESMVTERMRILLISEHLMDAASLDQLEVRRAKQHLNDDAFLQSVVAKVATSAVRGRTPPQPPGAQELEQLRTILRPAIAQAGSLPDANRQALANVLSTASLRPVINTFFQEVRGAMEATLRRPERGLLPKGATPTEQNMAAEFVRNRQNVSMTGTLTGEQTRAFSAALKQMPTVEALLQGEPLPGYVQSGPGVLEPAWLDGGSVADTIEVADGKTLDDEAKQTIRDRVDDADVFIKGMVESHLLRRIPKPLCVVHARSSSGFWNPFGFRAYQGGSRVHIAQNEPVDTIVHEIGHYLELMLPSEVWHDIRVLMESRHEAAGGGTTAARSWSMPLSEGRYKGAYPATKDYTSRAYSDEGGTEVMSMTMEFLAREPRTVIEKDPQQAALILRGLRPQEYASIAELRQFDSFLPH